MSKRAKGRRYDTESKLNIKKVIAVIVAIAVIIMFVVGIKTLLTQSTSGPLISTNSYYPVYTNQKWGVINEKGEIVIPTEYTEMITIPNKKNDLFIILSDVDYTNNTYKTKVINSKQEEQFTNYDSVEVIENMDKNNDTWYEEGVLRVKKGNLYGLIDYTGKEILQAEYTKIEALLGVEKSFVVTKSDKVGIVDNSGKIIIEAEYKEIKAIGDNYQNGYIVVDSNNKYGVIDFTGKVILDTTYEEIKPVTANNIYIVKENGVLKAINKEKEVLLENAFEDVKEIVNENLVIIKEGKYGIINIKGETKIEATYDELEFMSNNQYIAKKSQNYGVINIENKEVMNFEYSNITYFKEANVIEGEKGEECKYFNLKFEEISETESMKLKGMLDVIGKWKLVKDYNLYYYTDK